jgi:hypothetical protein
MDTDVKAKLPRRVHECEGVPLAQHEAAWLGAVPSQLARGKPDLQMRCALGVSSILLVAVLDEISLD